MLTDAQRRCAEAIRFLRFNWFQNPEVISNEQLQTVGLNSEYLKNDLELFEIFWVRLYRRLSKPYRDLLDLIDPENFVWQVKIMWILLKTKQRKELKYEQIREAITVPELFGEDGSLTLVEENRRREALKILQRTKFTWERNPIEVLKEKLEIVGLNLDIFWESLTLFKKLKHRLSRKFQVGRFREFHIFLESLNQKDYQWQIYTIWKVLFGTKFGEERYRLLRAMLHI